MILRVFEVDLRLHVTDALRNYLWRLNAYT